MDRRWNRLLPAVFAVALTGCGGGGAAPRLPDAQLGVQRQACTFDRGTLPRQTIGDEYPIGGQIPIDHFILLMQENRSFDSYFGTMPGVDGLPPGTSNPDASNTPVDSFHATQYCIDDTAHSWTQSHIEYDGGNNDGFVIANDPNGARAMGYLDGSDLPFYWDLYSKFAMSDRHFCSVLSSTWTNRWYYTSATSFGRTDNTALPSTFYQGFQGPYNIMQELDDAGIEWHLYQNGEPVFLALYPDYYLQHSSHVFSMDAFYQDAAAGNLPPVTWIDPPFAGGQMQADEHPPADPQVGEAFVAQVVNAVMQSPEWKSTALIITYDEHGGFYDHVPPPPACVPDQYVAADDSGTPRPEGTFDRYGFRVPLVIVSPYAKAGYVSHQVTDHTSILRLVEARFGLPALSARDANAWPLLDMFDFANPPYEQPPQLVSAPIDQTQLNSTNPTCGS